MVKKVNVATQPDPQEELWKKTEALLDAMGWSVEVNTYRRCWDFHLSLSPVNIAFSLPDSLLKEFRRMHNLGPHDNDPACDAAWLAVIERLALKWYLEAHSFEDDFRRDAGLPVQPSPEEDLIYGVSAEGEISPALKKVWEQHLTDGKEA